MAKGILIAAMDFSAAPEDEFHDWYDLEHVPERLRVPGFLNADRWLGTTPWLTLVGLLLGIAAGFVNLFRVVKDSEQR